MPLLSPERIGFHMDVKYTLQELEADMAIVIALLVIVVALILMGWLVGHFGRSRRAQKQG